VEGLLDSVNDDLTTGRRHFWNDRYHARILATLKDRAWRSAELLELCRMAFIRLNETLFPAGPQPQGIRALLNLFRQTTPIRELLTQRLVTGANAAMAFVRSRKPRLVLRSPEAGELLEQGDLDDTRRAAETLIECTREQLCGPELPIKDEPED
jgi:hypothetical protein